MAGFKKILACLTASALMAVSLLHGSEIVLCIAEDGHVAIEKAMNGQCIPSPGIPSQTPIPLAAAHAGNHCGPCSDVPFAAPLLTLPSRTEHVAAKAPAHEITPFLPGHAAFSALVMGIDLRRGATGLAAIPPACPPPQFVVLRN